MCLDEKKDRSRVRIGRQAGDEVEESGTHSPALSLPRAGKRGGKRHRHSRRRIEVREGATGAAKRQSKC